MSKTLNLIFSSARLFALVFVVFFGAGKAGGFTIKIQHPDGTETIVKNVDGTPIAASKDKSTDLTPGNSGTIQAEHPIASSNPNVGSPYSAKEIPIVIGVLADLDKQASTKDSSEQPTFQLKSNIVTESQLFAFGTRQFRWFALGDKVAVPVETTVNGTRYALVCVDTNHFLGDSELRGHINGVTTAPTGVFLAFDNTLAERLLQFSKDNLGSKYSIIIQGNLVTAPTLAASSIMVQPSAGAMLKVSDGGGSSGWTKQLTDLIFSKK